MVIDLYGPIEFIAIWSEGVWGFITAVVVYQVAPLQGPLMYCVSQTTWRSVLPKRKNWKYKAFSPRKSPRQTKPPFICYLPSLSSPSCHSLWPCLFPSLAHSLWSLCRLSLTVILVLCSFIPSFLSIVLPSAPLQFPVLWPQVITVTVGPNHSIIFLSLLSHTLVI